MSESERRRNYHHNRILIETARILSPAFDDAVVFLSGAQIEMLRNVSQYLNRQETYVTEYNPGYYLMPTVADYDDILEIVADLEETLMGNPNTLFGYNERIHEDMGETKSGDGNYGVFSEYVPEGKVWLLQHVWFQNNTAHRGTLYIQVKAGTATQRLIMDTNPVNTLHAWTGLITMKEGDRVQIVQNSCIDGDVLTSGILANEMVVPA